ncbi:Cyclic AMP-responsive element-binding protein 3 [Fukomys damarensis]|uniref:Cyclic AMP-responsive element-binding protein 3 n=1 Tax=Fukomys damarensis TaxID=885580 RepID=A0A091DTA3_FUKDA|nr:Cyclic AMP-responsive element-binding protein 3 [Fukomys damarensis]
MMAQMDLALDPDDQDLLGFLLEESGHLGSAPGEAQEAPLDWELPSSQNFVQELNDWEVENLLNALLSPPPSLDILNSSNICPVHHDHTYSLPHGHVSIDLDSGSCGKERAHMTPPNLEEPLEQESAKLILTEEEERLLEKEGLALSGTLPLTKVRLHSLSKGCGGLSVPITQILFSLYQYLGKKDEMEEQVLKRVRRKIRNKRSAQESRRKKKVYLGGLESRVLKYTAQNLELQNKVQLLEEENLSLLDQVRKLQAMVIEISNKTSSSSTCVLVLLCSFCLLFVPAMYSSDTRGSLPAEHVVLSRQLRALPSEDPHQPELPVLQSAVPVDSINQLLDSSNLALQAPGNCSCLLHHMPQPSQAEPLQYQPLLNLFSEPPCPVLMLHLQANLTRKKSVILQSRYSG